MKKPCIRTGIESIKIITKSFKAAAPSEKFQIINKEHQEIGTRVKKALERNLNFPEEKIEVIPLENLISDTTSPCPDNSLLITIGGDGTFLNTAHAIDSSNSYILGINSKPRSSIGKLCSYQFYEAHPDDPPIKLENCIFGCNFSITDVDQIADKLCQKLGEGDFGVLKRKRIKIRQLDGDRYLDKFPLGK